VFVDRHHPPYKAAGAVLLALVAVASVAIYLQFRGEFAPTTQLTLVSKRAGLVVDPGSKVTYNGVEIGRVTDIAATQADGVPNATLTLEVDPRHLDIIPANVRADITATTVFGNKYVSFSSPEDPSAERISSGDEIHVTSVTTEFNTLFETVTEIAEKVDPVKLNQTLTATATALAGLGQRFGESLVNGNHILADLNPRLPQIRYDIARVADLADVYANASPDLWAGLEQGLATAETLTDQRDAVDAALMAAIGFANTATDPFERAGPYLVRGAEDLQPTAKLLDDYRGMIFCTIRNYHDVSPKVYAALGGNGYSLASSGALVNIGVPNPYVYPDNLPRINAKGGPEGRPGCWQKITRELWPAPYLVMDTGISIAPYTHLEVGQPVFVDYVWGRQLGEYTINP
jgi:phospholipid/cholesterol/gamma-HCH transport system substrate-binding protein